MKKIFLFVIFIILAIITYSQDIPYNIHEPHKINGLDYEQILTIGEGSNGVIYACGYHSKIYSFQNEEWINFSIPGSDNIIQEIIGDQEGNLYVAIRNEGLWVKKNNSWKLYNHLNSIMPENPVFGGIAWAENLSTLYVGTNEGLVSFKDENLTIYNQSTVGVEMIDDEILDLVIDKSGSIWMISELATLIELTDGVFTSQAIGWDLQIFDLTFEKMDIKSNGDIVITTFDHGLMIFDETGPFFFNDLDFSLSAIGVDQSDHVWFTDESILWDYHMDNLVSLEHPFVPIQLFEIYVSTDNHIWLGGENGEIIEILQGEVILPTSEVIKEDIVIFPNPLVLGQLLNIEIEQYDADALLRLYDVYGRLVKEDLGIGKNVLNIPVGLYFLTFLTEKGNGVTRLIIE